MYRLYGGKEDHIRKALNNIDKAITYINDASNEVGLAAFNTKDMNESNLYDLISTNLRDIRDMLYHIKDVLQRYA